MKNTTKNLNFFGIGRLLPYLQPHKMALIWMCLLGIGVSLNRIVVPVFQKYALDHFVGNSTLDTLLEFTVVYFSCILVAAWINYAATYLSFQIEVRIKWDLRNKAFEHLQKLSISYFNRNSVGYIHSRVMSDVSNIGKMISWRIVDVIWQMTYLVGAICVMLSINKKLTFAILLILPVITLLLVYSRKNCLK